jgi:hypothetical protein
MRDLEICNVQATSLPKNTPTHPLTGQRIVITRGSLKGYYANIKFVGNTVITVEVDGLSGASSRIQTIKITDIMLM